MGSDCVDVTLTPNRTVTQPPAGVNDNPEEQHASPQLLQVFQAADIHGDGINRVWSSAIRIPQAATDSIKQTVFRFWPKHSNAIIKFQSFFQKSYVEAGIELPPRCRGFGQVRVHTALRTRVAFPSTQTTRAPKPCLRIDSCPASLGQQATNRRALLPVLATRWATWGDTRCTLPGDIGSIHVVRVSFIKISAPSPSTVA